jgi:hypothetical protein
LIIKVDQCAEQVRIAGRRLDPLLPGNRTQVGTGAVDEDRMLAFDLEDIRLPGHRPEGAEAVRLGPVQGILAPQPRVDVMDLLAGVKLRIDDLVIQPPALEPVEPRWCSIFGHVVSSRLIWTEEDPRRPGRQAQPPANWLKASQTPP